MADEVQLLKEHIKRLGTTPGVDGSIASVKFGILVRDDIVCDTFEALVGTLRAAKRQKIVAFDGELLLQGPHDNVDVKLLVE